MANEREKQLYQDVERSFDASAVTLNELAAEMLQIESKYGRESALLKKKTDQLKTLRDLSDKTLTYINYLRNLNDRMYQEVITRDLERHRRETGLSYAQIAELAGLTDPERWATLDKHEKILQEARAKFGILDEEGSLETFLQALRGK